MFFLKVRIFSPQSLKTFAKARNVFRKEHFNTKRFLGYVEFNFDKPAGQKWERSLQLRKNWKKLEKTFEEMKKKGLKVLFWKGQPVAKFWSIVLNFPAQSWKTSKLPKFKNLHFPWNWSSGQVECSLETPAENFCRDYEKFSFRLQKFSEIEKFNPNIINGDGVTRQTQCSFENL